MSSVTYFYGTGRRKTGTARVFIREGKGDFFIRKPKKGRAKPQKKSAGKGKGKAVRQKFLPLDIKSYFAKPEQVQTALAPLQALNLTKSLDIMATIKGGGFNGQAEAVRHGLSRALLKMSEEHRPLLKKKGFLTRDPRMVERKKYGRHKARKSSQFSKR